MNDKKYSEALPLLEKAIANRRFSWQTPHFQAIHILNLALCNIELGFLDDAWQLIIKADTIIDTTKKEKFFYFRSFNPAKKRLSQNDIVSYREKSEQAKGDYYQRLSYSSGSIEHAMQAEIHYKNNANDNPVYYTEISNMFIAHLDFEKAFVYAEEALLHFVRSEYSAVAFSNLMHIHKLMGNIEGIRRLVKKAKEVKFKGVMDMENELRLLEEEDLKYFMATSKPLSCAFKNLVKLYQTNPKTVYEVVLFSKKQGFQSNIIKPERGKNCIVGINFVDLDENFKKDNNLPVDGMMFLDLSKEADKPCVLITQDNVPSYFGAYCINFEKRKECYRLNRYNANEFEAAVGLKFEEIIEYSIFFNFVNHYNKRFRNTIERCLTETPDGREAERILILNFGEFLVEVLDEKTDYEVLIYSLKEDENEKMTKDVFSHHYI